MRIAGRDKLDEFSGAHADARSWIDTWIADAETAVWKTPQDIKINGSSADQVGDL